MKLVLLTFILLVRSHLLIGQPDKSAILKPIDNLFDGMKTGDSAKVRTAFSANAILSGIEKDKQGSAKVSIASLENFLKAIGTPHKEVWNERVWGIVVQQDGELAQVWAQYAFYKGNTFSHCGVDAFQLLKEAGGWKIITLIDTRRKENCNIPKAISDAFK
jgi:hypothetical protein